MCIKGRASPGVTCGKEGAPCMGSTVLRWPVSLFSSNSRYCNKHPLPIPSAPTFSATLLRLRYNQPSAFFLPFKGSKKAEGR